MKKSKQCGVDTCFLIDLADGQPTHAAVLQELIKHGYVVFAPPTVLEELAYIALKSKDHAPKVKALALTSLQSLRLWRIAPYNLIPASHGLVELNGDALRRQGIVPDEERHDSFILVEVSLLNGSLLITTNSDLLQINRTAESLTRYMQFMDERDLMPAVVIHPREIIKRLTRIKGN